MPYSPTYKDPRFQGAKPLGQFNNTQTYQTPSHLEDKATVLGKEIKGTHTVKYLSLLTQNSYQGVMASRRQRGMIVTVELLDNDTAHYEPYLLLNEPGYALSDWKRLIPVVGNAIEVYVRDTLIERDAINDQTVGDIAIVKQVNVNGDTVSVMYAWDGDIWDEINFLSELADLHEPNTDTQLIRSNGDALTADYIYNQLFNALNSGDLTQINQRLTTLENLVVSEGDINQKDADILQDAKDYADSLTNTGGPGLDLDDIAVSETQEPDWIPIVHNGNKLFLDPDRLDILLQPTIHEWDVAAGTTSLAIPAGLPSIVAVYNIFVGGSIQSPDEYVTLDQSLIFNDPIPFDATVMIVYTGYSNTVITPTEPDFRVGAVSTLPTSEAQLIAVTAQQGKPFPAGDTITIANQDFQRVIFAISNAHNFTDIRIGNGPLNEYPDLQKQTLGRYTMVYTNPLVASTGRGWKLTGN